MRVINKINITSHSLSVTHMDMVSSKYSAELAPEVVKY